MNRPAHHRLAPWQRHVLYLSGIGLVASGAGWLALHYAAGTGADQMPQPLEAWLMRLHGLVALAAVFGLGAIAATHVPQGWRLSQRRRWVRQRVSGLLLCGCGVVLVLSGYALYYFAPEWLRPALGWAHAVVGFATTLLVGVHRRGGSISHNA